MATASTHVIQYLAEIRDVQKKISELDRLNKITAQNLGSEFSKATQIISQNLDKTSKRRIIDSQGVTQGIEKVRQFSTVVKTADGSLRTITETEKRFNGQLKGMTSAVTAGGKATRTFSQDIQNLVKRAALTIPVWFALRNSISSVFRTIRDGLGDLGDAERAFQKLRQNLLSTSNDVEGDLDRIRKALLELSLQTGIEIEKLINATQKFATVGFNTEESLKGAIESTKLAVTLFGDATETADAFARSLRVLIDRSEGADSAGQQIAETMALVSQLWKDNQFDINEVNQGLEKFSAVAKTTNLSMKETVTLLATLGTAAVGGARGGTLLRTSLQKLLDNIDKVATEIGVFRTESDTTFTLLLKITDVLANMGDNFDAVVQRSNALREVFGGVRGSLPIQALTSLNDLLRRNANLTANVTQFNKEFEDLTKTLPLLQDRFKNLNREIGKAFVTGLTGGEDFLDALEKIISVQENLRDGAEQFGAVIRQAFLVGGTTAVLAFRKQLLSLVPLLTRTLPSAASFALLAFSTLNLAEEFQRTVRDARGAVDAANKIGQDIGENILRGIRRQLNEDELEKLITQLETFGAVELGLPAEQFEQTLKTLRTSLSVLQSITEETRKQEQAQRNNQEISELIVADTIERLKVQGRLTSEILKSEAALIRQFGIREESLKTLERELATERALSEEQRLRADLSSDTVKLFQIAKTEGTAVAKRIGDVLAGNLDFAQFVRRGGKELEIFQKQFNDIFEQQQAKAFFAGDVVPGLQGLRGGSRITTAESGRSTSGVLAEALIRFNKATDRFNQLEGLTQIPQDIKELRAGTLTVESFTPGFGRGTNLATNVAQTIPLSAVERQRAISFGGGRPDQRVALTIDVTGNRQVLVGTQEQIAEAMAEAGKGQFKQFFIDSLKNVEDPLTQQIRTNVEEF